MNNDLISREALKKALELTDYNDIYDLTITERLIDNAPTVAKIDTNDIEHKAYCKGLEDGKKIAIPQGVWSIDYDGTYEYGNYKCSKCKQESNNCYLFCPNCGSKNGKVHLNLIRKKGE